MAVRRGAALGRPDEPQSHDKSPLQGQSALVVLEGAKACEYKNQGTAATCTSPAQAIDINHQLLIALIFFDVIT